MATVPRDSEPSTEEREAMRRAFAVHAEDWDRATPLAEVLEALAARSGAER